MIAFPNILLSTLSMPIGLTPGFLFNGIRVHATKLSMFLSVCSWHDSMHMILAISAIAFARSVLYQPYDLDNNILLQASTSSFDGPAAPLVLTAAFCMLSPSMLS